MKTSVKHLSDTKVVLTIAVTPDELKAAELVALTKIAKEIKVPGFRKGKVPANVVAKHADPQLVGQQTLEDALSKAVADAFAAEKLQALDRPEVEVKKYEPGKELEFTAEYDPALADVAGLIGSVQAELSEAVSTLRRYADRVDLDPSRLAEVERRMDAVMAHARKFRVQPAELPGLLTGWQQRLAALDESADLAALEARLAAAQAAYRKLAEKLSAGRLKAARDMGKAVSEVMRQLALSSGRFEVALPEVAGGAVYGLEQVEFRIGGLAGNEAKPLAKVASGGELSRISLAIQVLTSRSASVPTLIFDEVDVGIGGGVAEIVGRLLRELGGERQVLCVTHLPQVAAQADWQWQVSKATRNGVTLSAIQPLDEEGRVQEIARMLGGVEITDITRQHASELLRKPA